MSEINPAWESAPYRVDFLFSFQLPQTSRRRIRLKSKRRQVRKFLAGVKPPKVFGIDALPLIWRGGI